MGAAEPHPARSSEIAHILFMDIVAYSKLRMEQQEQLLHELQEAVRHTPEFVRASAEDQLIRLPTGDGMALVFFRDPEAAVRCALELSQALREHPEIKLRMGIHTGPVYRVADINANLNVAGGGINIAQRVMDCGDPGHILVSKETAEMLREVGGWEGSLRNLGELKVKHGLRLHLYELSKQEAGRSVRSKKLRLIRARRVRRALAVTLTAVVAAGMLGAWLIYTRKAHALTEADTVVLADFENKTGDPVFDDTLKTGLTVALNQSPFLNVLPHSKIAATLKLMDRPANAALTPEVARQLGQRAGSKVYISGSIAGLGSQYVLGLKAVNCRSGDVLVQEQVTAATKEKVLDALGAEAAKLREELGESLATVQKFDVPLDEATTTSLEALKAYSLGAKASNERGSIAALPYHLRAIRLDPNFAMGYLAVGRDYESLGESGTSQKYYAKAFELREHTSEVEKLNITADYYSHVTGEWDKEMQPLQEWIALYPRSRAAHGLLGNVYAAQGQFEKASNEYREVLRLAPDSFGGYQNLAYYLMAQERFEEARQVIQQAEAKKLDGYYVHLELYALAFLGGDSAAAVKELQWFRGRPEEYKELSLASDTEAYGGRLTKARELSKRAVDMAVRDDMKEEGAIWQENAALREAAFGNSSGAKSWAAEGLKLYPDSVSIKVEAALALALAGDATRASFLAQDLNTRFPVNAYVQSQWLPAIRAQLALNRGNSTEALDDLQAVTTPVELGTVPFMLNVTCLYPVYVRGEAYLAAGQGKLAAVEFQKILSHGGLVWNCWTGALARLGVARANALQGKTSQGSDADAARARAEVAYKDFLTRWNDADPDIPILKQAKAEYAKLQ